MISVIVPVRNRTELLVKCVHRVKALANGACEIIVVDDASDGGIGMEDEGVKVIVNPVSLGPGGARNAGAKQAQGDILFFIDSDIILCDNAFEKVAGSLSCSTYEGVQGRFAAQAAYPGFFSVYKNLYWNFNQSRMDPQSYSLCTAIFAIRKETFWKTGGFNESSLIGEDREFGAQLKKRNAKILQAKELQGTHYKNFDFKGLMLHHFQNAVNYGTFLLNSRAIAGGDRKAEILAILLIPLLVLFSTVVFLFFQSNHLFLVLGALLWALYFFFARDFFGYCKKQKGVVFAVSALLIQMLEHMVAFGGLGWSAVRYFLCHRRDLDFRIGTGS